MKTARAPGKLIISGEHAVVHGAPAIAIAVNRYASATALQQHESLISFNLLNLSYHKSMTKKALKEIKHRLGESYESFKRGEHSIKDVLKLPFELSQFALGHFLEKINPHDEDGIKLTTQSEIPMNAGMGSSAAMILAVMHAIALSKNKNFDNEYYYQHALETENLQHGKSSGLDIRICLQGGCLYFQNGEFETIPVSQHPIHIVNTGKSASSTGECVEHAKKYFETSALMNDFTAVTQQVKQALSTQDFSAFKKAINDNHRLLCQINVVPDKIQSFIGELEQNGFAAKICGAGAVHGDNAGIVMIIGEHSPEALCAKYNYTLQTIQVDTHGLHQH